MSAPWASRLALALAAAALGLAASPAAQAAFPGRNGRIAYVDVSAGTGAPAIRGIRPSGRDPRVLVAAGDWRPSGKALAYSPSGQLLAMPASQPPSPDQPGHTAYVAAVPSAGGVPHPITAPAPGRVDEVAFSRTGTR